MDGARRSLLNGRLGPGLVAAALAAGLALAGLRFPVFVEPSLNLLFAAGWLAAVAYGFSTLQLEHGALGGVAAVAAAFYLWLALGTGPPLAAGLAAAALLIALFLLAAGLRAEGGARPGLGRLGGLAVGALLGSAGAVIRLPASAAPDVLFGTHILRLANWMIPAVVAAVALTSAALPAVQWARRRLGLEPPGAGRGLPTHLAAQFNTTPRRAAWALWGASAVCGLYGLLLARLDALPANLGAGGLAVGILAALNFRELRAVGRGPLLVYAHSAGVLLLFVASLKYRFLNRLFPGVMPGYIGWDFFTIPRAFDNMLHGATMYHRTFMIYQSSYGPYATEPFSPHPLLAVLPGGLLFMLPPFVAYGLFVAFSIAALAGLFWLYQRFAAGPLQRSLIALFLFASWPVYGMLWMGQMHIFPVIAYGLIGIGLLGALAGRRNWQVPFAAGFLVSLFSKPVLILALPIALLARPTRRAALAVAGLYALVSLVFVTVPPLNPGQIRLRAVLAGRAGLHRYIDSANLYHWAYIFMRGDWLATNWREVFSGPVLLNVVLPADLAVRIGQMLMFSLLAYLAWAVTQVRPRYWALYLAALALVMVNAAYFYSYSLVFEYQYTTLALAAVALLLLRARTDDAPLRRYLLAGLILYVPMLLPSLYGVVVPNPVPDVYWDFSGETLRQMTLFRASRVLPVILMNIPLLLAAGRVRQLAGQEAGA